MINPWKTSLTLVCVGVLTACGGSSSGSDDNNNSTPPPAPVQYEAVADTSSTADDQAVTIDVFANDTSENEDSFEITEVTQPENGSAEISETSIVYTPNAGFAGTDTFSYTATDGTQEDTAEVTVTVSQTVSIAGRVTDAPLANATVSITINGETHTATTNEDGDYELELSMTDLSSNSRPRLSATGDGEQAYITLSSRLPSIQDILSAAGDDRTLVRAESNQVQVTQLSTAENIVLEQLADGEDITDDNIQMLQTDFDSDLMLEMAAAIKLLADNPDYSLPEGYDTIEAFLADAEAYNAFVEDADASGDLQAALDETLNDPEVAEPPSETGFAAYYGDYIVSNMNSRYTGRFAPSSFTFSEAGVSFSGNPASSVTQAADGSFSTSAEAGFLTSYMYYSWFVANNIEMDEATAIALKEYLAASTYQPTMPLSLEVTNINFLHRSNERVLANVTEQTSMFDYSFSWNGTEYTIPAQVARTATYTKSLLPVDGLVSGVEFDIVNGSQWLLPLAFDYWVDVQQDFGVSVNKSTQLVTLTTTDGMSGEFVNDLSGESGTWQLSDDKRELSYSITIADEVYDFSLRYARNDEHGTDFVVKSSSNVSEQVPAFTLQRAGELDLSLAPEILVSEPDEISAALLNMWSSNQWTDNGPNLDAPIDWMYGWHFAADQSMQYVLADCEGDVYEPCSAERFFWSTPPEYSRMRNMEWAAMDNFVHLALPDYSSAPECTGELSCGGRFVAPISVNENTGIITILEMEYAVADSPYNDNWLVSDGIFQRIPPRINYWYHMPFNGVFDQPAGSQRFASPIATYKKVLHWEQKPGQQH